MTPEQMFKAALAAGIGFDVARRCPICAEGRRNARAA